MGEAKRRRGAANEGEVWPEVVRPLTERLDFDRSRRALGIAEGEVVELAERWWDRTGRHLIRQPEWRDPDAGFDSGITRGLAWMQLGALERQKVILAFWQCKVAPKLAELECGLSLGAPAPGSSASRHILLTQEGGGTASASPAGGTAMPGATTRPGERSS